MAHDYPLFSSVLDNNPDLSELPDSHNTGKAAGRYFYVFDSLFCSTIRCHQAPQQLLGILSHSTMELWECFCHVPLESASRSVNNYSKPFFGLCHDFWVPFKKNKRLSSKQNKSALSRQLTALCMELKQNYKMETEKSTVFILSSFCCICSEKLDFWGCLCCDYPKKPQDCTWHSLKWEAALFRESNRQSCPFHGTADRQGCPHCGHAWATRSQALCWGRGQRPWEAAVPVRNSPSLAISTAQLALSASCKSLPSWGKAAQPQPCHILFPSSWWQPWAASRDRVRRLKVEEYLSLLASDQCLAGGCLNLAVVFSLASVLKD